MPSLFDQLKAAASVAANSAKEALEERAGELQRSVGERASALEGEVADEGWYQGLRKAGDLGGEVASGVLKGAAGIGQHLFVEAGRTELGRGLGASTREITAVLGSMPVVSAMSDVRRAMHGIDGLHAHLLEDPGDAERSLWLAEALAGLASDRDRAVMLRVLMNPGSLLKVAAFRTTRALGAEGESARVRLLQAAFARAVAALQQEPADARHLHVLSRVYLATGHLPHAARFARLAALAAPEDGRPLVTLARIYRALGRRDAAREAARLGAERGCTAGYAVLADMVLEDAEVAPAERLELHGLLLERINEEDMVAYYGPRTRGFAVLEAAGRAQWEKARQLMEGRIPEGGG
jgi:hypothetical protein